MARRIFLYDTTLRDGAQTSGVDFTLQDKRQISLWLDELGVDYIEGGYPGANPLDDEHFAHPPQTRATYTAFGMTKRGGRSVSNDTGLQTLLSTPVQALCFVAKTWDKQVLEALGQSLEDNLEGLDQTVRAAVAKGYEVIVDAEHAFDGAMSNHGYVEQCADVALKAGARWFVLCDTNGGTLPDGIRHVVSRLSQKFGGECLGIHTHNDTGHAVANSLAALEAGVCHIQGTVNGLGERCGNADLITLMGNLKLKPSLKQAYNIQVTEEALQRLSPLARAIDERLNRTPNRHAPFVGENAFAHKGGIHASAVRKDPSSYEHVAPESVGNSRKILVSDQAGRSNLLEALERVGIDIKPDDARLTLLLEEVKGRENMGYAYDGADASFEVLARRRLGQMPVYFTVDRYRVNVERRLNTAGVWETVAEAVVKVRVGDETLITAAEGNGPVNALDIALRKDLGKYQHLINDMHLSDYRVRILNGGTEAITRVVIESSDANGQRWCTVGVSSNIIEASFEALMDSLNYRIFHASLPKQS